jgi:hypothetical protein
MKTHKLHTNPHLKIVSFTDEHEEGVNTSLELNPCYYKFEGHDVISIFLRKDFYERNINYDGNPLMYVIRGERGWKFKNNGQKREMEFLMRRFCEIAKKVELSKYDTLIIIPSRHFLNRQLAAALVRVAPHLHLISKFFYKLTKTEALDSVDWDKMENDYEKKKTEKIEDELYKDISKMGEYFSVNKLRQENRKYLKYFKVETVITSEKEEVREYIDNKNVLIFDEMMSSGATVSLYIKGLLSLYKPKSTTIITMLSKLNAR